MLICIEFEVIAIFEILFQRQRYLGIINAVECLRFACLLRLLHKIPDFEGERRRLLAIGNLGAESGQTIVIVEYLVACAGCKGVEQAGISDRLSERERESELSYPSCVAIVPSGDYRCDLCQIDWRTFDVWSSRPCSLPPSGRRQVVCSQLYAYPCGTDRADISFPDDSSSVCVRVSCTCSSRGCSCIASFLLVCGKRIRLRLEQFSGTHSTSLLPVFKSTPSSKLWFVLCQLAAIFIKASRSLAVYCLFTCARETDRERERDQYISYTSNAHYNSPKIDSIPCSSRGYFGMQSLCAPLETHLTRHWTALVACLRGRAGSKRRGGAKKQKDSFALLLLPLFLWLILDINIDSDSDWHCAIWRQYAATLIDFQLANRYGGAKRRGFTQNNQNVCRPFLFLSKWAKKLWITMSEGDGDGCIMYAVEIKRFIKLRTHARAHTLAHTHTALGQQLPTFCVCVSYFCGGRSNVTLTANYIKIAHTRNENEYTHTSSR